METVTLNEIKGSEYYRIVAAVLEVVEKALTEPQRDVTIQQSTTDTDNWKMVFVKKNSSLDELNSIKQELGKNFSVNIQPKDKGTLMISVEAPSEDFYKLLSKNNGHQAPVSVPQPSLL